MLSSFINIDITTRLSYPRTLAGVDVALAIFYSNHTGKTAILSGSHAFLRRLKYRYFSDSRVFLLWLFELFTTEARNTQ